MKASKRGAAVSTAMAYYVEKHGDQVWFCICDNILAGKWFKVPEAADIVYRNA